MPTDAITRLRAANPAAVDPDRAHQPLAQATLQRILDSPPPASSPAIRPVRPRGLALVLAVVVLAAGGALAATDPLGWWSSNPGEAHYRVSTTTRVRTPTAENIRCRRDGTGGFACVAVREVCYQVGRRPPRCGLAGSGLPYMYIGAIPAPPPDSVFSRSGFERAITKAVTKGTMTAAQAARFRADLARVPNSFFSEFRLASEFGTYSAGDQTANGKTIVPPLGQPSVLVCTDAAHGLDCQNLNGDADAPAGAGVYGALPGPGWRKVPTPRYIGGIPPGVHFTHADYQVLIDLARFGTTTSRGGTRGLRTTTVKVIHRSH